MIQADKINDLSARKLFIILTIAVLITDLAILLNIPFLRQIFGFLFLTISPGLLILQILKLNKIGYTEKIVLSVGLSIAFLMFFGLLINNLSLSLGYETPLSTISLLISFNIAILILAIIGYKINKTRLFSIPDPNLTTSEKAFLIVPILFPALSIFGMYVMNTTDNNLILMLMLFLIPIYVVSVCFFNHKFPNRLYPFAIFSISISLLMLYMLRFPHICGSDVHIEYYFFQTTLSNLHWGMIEYSTLDACLSISLLPTIYQSIMNVNAQEYLFKGVYVSLFSFSPLIIYVISKKYVGELYAFLASFLFMSQTVFLSTAGSPRTNTAIFFVALAVMVFFSDKIEPLKRRFLFIVFILATIVSHYSTTYVFFFIILFTWFAMEIFSKKYAFKKAVSLTLVILFFAFIFFWYSQLTGTPFNAGVSFVEDTFINLNNFFIEESRTEEYAKLVGQELAYPILSNVSLASTWSTFILIGIGVLAMVRKYKEMVYIPDAKQKKSDFLKTKFEMEYLLMTVACAGLLVFMVALPYISIGYGIQRLYLLVLIILSVCFVMGGMTLSHFFFLQKKTCAKRKSIDQNASGVLAYLIILLVLIPYSMFGTGALYQIFDAPASMNLNSEGGALDYRYIHDSESCAAKWLMINGKFPIHSRNIYTTDTSGWRHVISQGVISTNRVNFWSFSKHGTLRGYIFLGYNNVVKGRVTAGTGNMTEYSDMFVGKNKIYANDGSEVWK